MGDKMIHLIQFMEKDGMKKREWCFFDTLNVGECRQMTSCGSSQVNDVER